jgi:hypothetical protein
MKILPVGGELFLRTDVRADRHYGSNRLFSQFCETHENSNSKELFGNSLHITLTVVATIHSAKFSPLKFIRIKLLSFPTGAGDSPILQKVEICSVEHPVSYLMGVWGSGLKRPSLRAGHTPPMIIS